jgi:hypothetical protein
MTEKAIFLMTATETAFKIQREAALEKSPKQAFLLKDIQKRIAAARKHSIEFGPRESEERSRC